MKNYTKCFSYASQSHLRVTVTLVHPFWKATILVRVWTSVKFGSALISVELTVSNACTWAG